MAAKEEVSRLQALGGDTVLVQQTVLAAASDVAPGSDSLDDAAQALAAFVRRVPSGAPSPTAAGASTAAAVAAGAAGFEAVGRGNGTMVARTVAVARTQVAQPPADVQARSRDLAALLSELLATPEGRHAVIEQLSRAGSPCGEAAPGVELSEGQVIGRFEIVRELGRGGCGVVFEAKDRDLGRLVALKAVRPGRRSAQLDTMLLKEAESAARLQHDNIVALYDFGESETGPYLVLELLRGETLEDRLARGPLTPREAVRIGARVALGLAHAHQAGLLHRDLKPSNVFLTESGGVKVMDLGLAHLLGDATELSGTPPYMAPEQWRGEGQDARTDIFALGVTLFEMISGERPYGFADGTPDVLGPGEPLLDEPRAPRRLIRIVERAIAKDASRRPANAQDVADELFAIERAYETRGARRAAIAIPLALALVAGSVLAWKNRPQPPPPKAQSVLIADFENRTGEPVFDGTAEPALAVALEGASFINSFSRGEARRIAESLKMQGAGLDERRARLVAQREGLGIVATGSIFKLDRGYRVDVRALDAFTGDAIYEDAEEVPPDRERVLGAVTRIAARVRAALGDATPEAVQLREAETYGTSSVSAAHHYAMGTTAAALGKYEEAKQHFLDAVREDPALGRAYSQLGALDANRGRHAEARKYFKEAIARVDRMSEREKHRTRAAYYLFERDVDQAIGAYESLLKRYPSDDGALVNLSIAYQFKRDFARALAETRRALEIRPRDVMIVSNAGLFAQYDGQLDVAVAEHEHALAINPEFVYSHAGLALSKLAAGKRDEALAAWERLRATPGGASAAAEGLADLAAHEGRLADARALLLKGSEADLADKDSDAAARKLAALAALHLGTGDSKAAVRFARRALETGHQEYVMFQGALVLAQAGEDAQARAIADELDRRVAAEPRMFAEIIRGTIEQANGNHAEAVMRFKNALQRVDAWVARFALGRGYLAAGALTQAQDELEKCVKRRGEATDVFLDVVPTFRLYPGAHYELARALDAAGSAGAADAYRAFLAMKRSDEDPAVREARRRLAALTGKGV